MRLEGFSAETVDWDNLTPLQHLGEQGYALSRTLMAGELRIRKIDYSPGYRGDDWCEKGHIVLVLEGDIELQRKQVATERLGAGMSYHVPEGCDPHRLSTQAGAVLFIVD